mmetsp:Transcript_16081/g.20017  ORF Transcript_16081/g.20017 Transcript_16081/m.20017 type:complete len:152 (-) Transcript_16081:504-959(-)
MAAYNPFNTTITTATTSTTLVPRKTYNQFKKHEKQNLHPKKDKINHDSLTNNSNRKNPKPFIIANNGPPTTPVVDPIFNPQTIRLCVNSFACPSTAPFPSLADPIAVPDLSHRVRLHSQRLFKKRYKTCMQRFSFAKTPHLVHQRTSDFGQ